MLRRHFAQLLALAGAAALVGCNAQDRDQPAEPLGRARSALKVETDLNANAYTVAEGSGVQISGGGVTSSGAGAEIVTRVEVFWGETDPATGLQFTTTVCDTPDPAVADCPGGGSTSICMRRNATSPVSTHVYRDSLDRNGASSGDHSVTCVVSYNTDPATTLLLKQAGTPTGITVNEVASTVDANVNSPNPDTYPPYPPTNKVLEDVAFNPSAFFTDPSIDTAPTPDQLYERYECSIDFDTASTADPVQLWPRQCAAAADCPGGFVCNTADTAGGATGRCRTTAEQTAGTLPTCRPENLSDPAVFSFVYANPGTYTLGVDVLNLDADGTRSTDTATVTVEDTIPTITGLAAAPSPGAERSAVTFTATLANGSAVEPITQCTWDPDDAGPLLGQTFLVGTPQCRNDGTASTFAFTYTDGDDTTYTLRLTVEDADSPPTPGNAPSSTVAIVIANVAATVAAPTSASPLIEGNNIVFDSSFGDSPDEDWLVRWELLPGGGFEIDQCRATLGAVSATFLYMNQGTYNVMVRVRDQMDPASNPRCSAILGNSLAADSAIVPFVVADAMPQVVSLTNDSPRNEGGTVTFTYQARSGARDNTAADPITRCLWDFGDGTTATIAAGNPGCEPELAGRTISHVYAQSGAYTARLTVEDEEGALSTGTLTTSVTVSNVPPTVTLNPANATVVSEGTTLTVTASFTDPAGPLDAPYSCVVAWGDGQTTSIANCSSPFSAAHTYADDSAQDGVDTDPPNICGKGTCTVRVTVTDKDAGAGFAEYEVTVTNAPPVINSFSTNSPVAEGQPISVSVNATDPGAADTLLYDFDWNADGICDPAGQGDVCGSTLSGASHVYPNQGAYKVRVTVRDDDGGVATTPDINVTVTDVKPRIVAIYNTGPKAEAETVTGVIQTEIQSGDAYTFTWTFGDGTSTKSADVPAGSCLVANGCRVDPACTRACSHAYADDRAGGYTLTVTVADDDGNLAQATSAVTVNNLPPSGSASNNGSILEGGSATITATATDVPADVPSLRCNFDFNSDGVDEVTAVPVTQGRCTQTRVFADDGDFTVTVTLDDQDLGLTRVTTTVVVRNVAPTAVVASGCGTTAGSAGPPYSAAYACDLDSSDPAGANDTTTYTLVTGPAGMSVGLTTGVVSWTPTGDQSRSSQSYTVQLSDEDGGSSYFSRTVTSYVDLDGDGLPDVWENANGTNPAVADASADPDNDGLTNAQELALGTNPFTFDGPAGPVALAPIKGEEVATVTPTLRIRNAADPNGNPLTYTFEVFDNKALTGTPVASPPVQQGTGTLSGGGTYTEWTLTAALPDNAMSYWRARAHDGATFGPSSDVESFFVNTANDPPTAPALSAPADGSAVPTRYPAFQAGNATDLDRDVLTYTFEIATDAAFSAPLFATSTGVKEDPSGITSWTAGVPLLDNTKYYWRVRANDGTTDGPNSATRTVFVNTANNPPSAVEIVSPTDGAEVTSLTPNLVVRNATDADGDTLTYEFEIDRSAAFNSAVRSGRIDQNPSGQTSRTPTTALTENQTYYWRARAFDGTAAGDWSSASFFVNASNDAPSAPVPQNPLTGSFVDREAAKLTVRNAVDPDSKTITYTFSVFADEGLTQLVEESAALAEGPEETGFVPTNKLPAGSTFWWTAKATDDKGAAGPASEPQVIKTIGVQGGGCGCGQPGAASALLALLALVLRRRRA